MDVLEARLVIAKHLNNLGFRQVGPVSAFIKEDHPIRFKLGTANHSVTVSAWNSVGQIAVHRAHYLSHIPEILGKLSAYALEPR